MAFRLQSRLPCLLVLFVHVLLTSHSLLSNDHESNLKISFSVLRDVDALVNCCSDDPGKSMIVYSVFSVWLCRPNWRSRVRDADFFRIR